MNAQADWTAPRRSTQGTRSLGQRLLIYFVLPLGLLGLIVLTGMYLAAQYPNTWYTHASRITFEYLIEGPGQPLKTPQEEAPGDAAP